MADLVKYNVANPPAQNSESIEMMGSMPKVLQSPFQDPVAGCLLQSVESDITWKVFDVADTSGGFQLKVASFTPKIAADVASPGRFLRKDSLPVAASEAGQESTFDFFNEDTVENIYSGYAFDEGDNDGSSTEDGTPQAAATPPEDSFYSLHLPYYVKEVEEFYLDHPRPDSPTLGYLNHSVNLDTLDDIRPPVPCSENATPPDTRGHATQISLDDFVIIQAIGQGTTGGVFHVLHRKKQTRHALKAVMNVYREDGKERKSGMTRWLVEELSALKSVQTLKGFVGLEASWSDSKNFYFLSPLYATDLEYEIRDCGRLPRDRYTFYFAQLVIALQDLHSLGIIHRDVKPANLMLDFSGNLIVGDFGLSHEFSLKPSLEERTIQPYYPYWTTDHVSASGNANISRRPVDTMPYVLKGNCGSPAHMAPEMWLQEPYSFPVDWWSAGTVLYVMATGRLPFMVPHLESEAAFGLRVVHEELEFEPDEVDIETKHIIQQMLRKKPEDRLPILEIEKHPFFLGVDWPALRTREVTTPYIPPQDPTHALNGCSRPLTIGHPYEQGTNPCPEFDYIAPNFHRDTQVAQTPVVEETQGGSPRKRSTFSSVWSRLLAARKEAAFTDTRQGTRDPHPFVVLRDDDEQSAGGVQAAFFPVHKTLGKGTRDKVLQIDIPVTKSVGHQTAESPRMQYFKDRMRRIF